MNNTFLTLIPKTQDAKDFKYYRTISLCNVVYKTITKVMAERLKLIMAYIISNEHDGFVKGRQITDGIIKMHKVLHSVHKKKKPTMAIKLHMEKSYAKVRWIFLNMILTIFVFEMYGEVGSHNVSHPLCS